MHFPRQIKSDRGFRGKGPIAAMKAGAERLHGRGLDYAFLGGSVVSLLLDHSELSPLRATDDAHAANLAAELVKAGCLPAP
jgi:hypothetical protein